MHQFYSFSATVHKEDDLEPPTLYVVHARYVICHDLHVHILTSGRKSKSIPNYSEFKEVDVWRVLSMD